MRHCKIFSVVAAMACIAGLWMAADAVADGKLGTPSGKVVLEVEGAISANNAQGKARFDMAMLKAMKSRTITTATPWTKGQMTFEGPLLRDVLSAVGAKGKMIKAYAINNYLVKIPISDAHAYDVILAHTLNGKKMSVRDKGPLWVIYPWGENAKIRNEIYYARGIWQAKKFIIEE